MSAQALRAACLRNRFPVAGSRSSMPRAWPRVIRPPSSDGLSRLLFLECHRHSRVRRKANPLPLDVGDKSKVDEMRVALVLALAAVALREPDATVGDAVDSADMDAVRSDHFHVLGDLVRGHLVSPCGLTDCAGATRPPPSGAPRIANACAPGRNCGSSRGGVPAASRKSRLARRRPHVPRSPSGGVPPRQLPMRADEVAGVAVRMAFQVILVLGLGLPEIASRRELSHDLSRPQP